MKTSACFVIAVVLDVSMAQSAPAHPRPLAAAPAPDAVLTGAPAEIRITFSEGLIAPFSGLALRDAAGRNVAIGPAAVANDGRQLAAPIRARLAPGAYTVDWRAMGDDSHHVAGRYSFRIAPRR